MRWGKRSDMGSVRTTTIGKILFLLSAKERKRGAIVLCLITVMALLEAIGIASVLPFLAVLGNPKVVYTNPVLASAYSAFGMESLKGFLVALGVLSFALVLFSGLFRTLTHFAINRYVEMRRHSISERLLETYLRQPYSFFLDRSSADMAKNILTEVDQLILYILRPGMTLVAYAVVAAAIIGLLIVVDPVLAIVIALFFGGLYCFIYIIVRNALGRAGRDRLLANKERFETAGEALSGIKSIKLLGRERAYLSRFKGPSLRLAKQQVVVQIATQVPGFVIEALAFGSIILLTLMLLLTGSGPSSQDTLGELLPLIGLYTLAGLRLKPAAQYIYQGIAKLKYSGPIVNAVYEDLSNRSELAEIRKFVPSKLAPSNRVFLRDIAYSYPKAPKPALTDFNLIIPVGSSVGIVGGTGAGKTTVVDVLLGLLRPTSGAVMVDEVPVTESNLSNWQQALGYVPQDIYLADSTVSENIAFGVPLGDIDHAQVQHCAELAQIHDFVIDEMPSGYSTVVGERGIRLSGGQRQRIGIARALYRQPSVLVLDEATSALDTVTERAVLEAVRSMPGSITLVLIAHRLSTVRQCDNIILMEKGRVEASGRFEDLESKYEIFIAARSE